jgi:hypothetical protein
MTTPWYSGMAQGMTLSLFTRLHEVTGDSKWSTVADQIFHSLELNRSGTQPWVTFVDANGYLWFEEYAKNPPARVLNGHVFATFGMWDYARATRSAAAAALFDAAATTVAHYLPQFRRPGAPSAYALRIPVQDPKYHGIHVQLLAMLARLTGAPAFADWSEKFREDFSLPRPKATPSGTRTP